MTIDMSQFFQVFFDEAEELLAEKEKLLLAVDLASPDPEDLNAIFRAAHSIKGGSSTFGLTDMSEVTHILESLLDKIRKGEMALTSEHVDAFLAAKDILKMQLDGHRLGTPVDKDAVAEVQMLLQSLSQVEPKQLTSAATPAGPSESESGATAEQSDSVYKVAFRKIDDDDFAALINELGLFGQVTKHQIPNKFGLTLKTNRTQADVMEICTFILDASEVRITAEAPSTKQESTTTPATTLAAQSTSTVNPVVAGSISAPNAADVDKEEDLGYGFFEPLSSMFPPLEEPSKDGDGAVVESDPGQLAPSVNAHSGQDRRKTPKRDTEKSASSVESTTIRVGIEKVDQLINLIGELVISQAMLEQRALSLDPVEHAALLGNVANLTRNTRDLQEAVMSIRMMPMDYVFSRFPRMVRDLATKLGKKVELVTHGASTELDKGLIERIVDPLTHLVRNSIDHGIEMPMARRDTGKSEIGKLILSASHQGGNIVIEVSDDGGGLNRGKILAKAIQNGVPVSESMTDAEVWQLIFAPGFSTAEVVTDVSGRGVGMDVVKRNIAAMGGVVDIRSVYGTGTTITISLPLTLAILDGMSIKVGEEVYILPLGFVIESLQPSQQSVREVQGSGRLVKVRDEYLPLVCLYEIFSITPKYLNPEHGITVIVEVDGEKAALFVDDLVGQQQVVVKNIESNYRKVPGISGATILGDGNVSLILDVPALLRAAR